MTKHEALAYCEELEDAIDKALAVLQDDDIDPEDAIGKAIEILEEYEEESGEPEEEEK